MSIIRITRPKDSKTDPDLFHSANFDASIEYGAHNKNIHGHIILVIEHRTTISLKYDRIRSYFKQKLGLQHNPHCNARIIRNYQGMAVRDYVLKYTKRSTENQE